MDDYENLTNCNVLHSFRLCSKESFFSRNYSFNANRDCSVPGVLFNLISTIIVSIITVLGNLLIPAVIWRQRRTQWGPYGLCKLWLSVLDIIMGVFYMPIRVMMMVEVLYIPSSHDKKVVLKAAKDLAHIYNHQQHVFGSKVEQIHNFTYYLHPSNGSGPYNLQMLFKMYEVTNRPLVTTMSCLLSTYILLCTWILAVMAVDRYLALVFPFKYQRWVSVKRTKIGLTVSTLISLVMSTVWPLAHIELFFPTINNRFGFGATFLLGRHRIDHSREILAFFASWLMPFLAVIVFDVLTAYYCLFVMPRGSQRKRGCFLCQFSGRHLNEERRKSSTSQISFLSYNTTAFKSCCCSWYKPQKVQPENNQTQNNTTEVSQTHRRSQDQRKSDDTLEAFWTLVLMTAVFVLIMGSSFVLTMFVPVPCEDATYLTWIYIGVQFLFMNQPSTHILIYNFRSGNFRRQAKLVLKSLAGNARDRWGPRDLSTS